MSFFAGIFALSSESPAAYRQELEAAAALGPDFSISHYCDNQLVLLHGDLGVLPHGSWSLSEATAGALAGSLHLTQTQTSVQNSDLDEISVSLRAGRLEDLSKANGTLALCFYDRHAQRLVLASDCLGARPLYYTIASNYLFFATSLEVFERLPMIPITAEVASLFERGGPLCYPLGNRTIYTEIKVLVDNECLVAEQGSVTTRRYFDWATLPLASESVDDLALSCRKVFSEAVACRTIAGTQQHALLSGGLDSRVVVSELLDQKNEVAAINMGLEGFQDRVYATRFAAAAGVPLSSVPWHSDLVGDSTAATTAQFLNAAASSLAPAAVFTGDGGGETFGFLLLKKKALELLGAGQFEAGVNEYLKEDYVPRKLFVPEAYDQLVTAVSDRMKSELSQVCASCLEKALHIMVLGSDLRCHLHEYFNRLAHHRVELLLPFYDRRVIAATIRINPPLGPLLHHAFYYKIVALLDPRVTSVPWQTYPGHLPCPVLEPNPPPDQWSNRDLGGDKLAKRCFKLSLAPNFAPLMRRSTILMGALLHLLGRADYTYLFRMCLRIQSLCGDKRPFVIRDENGTNLSVKEGQA